MIRNRFATLFIPQNQIFRVLVTFDLVFCTKHILAHVFRIRIPRDKGENNKFQDVGAELEIFENNAEE
jgi:hypothetical protein